MFLREVRDLLDAEVLTGEDSLDAVEVRSCFAADLMSDVLRFSSTGTLLLTGLASAQSVHTADVAELAGIVFVAGKRPDAGTLALAGGRGIPLLTTRRALLDACGLLHAAGVTRAHV